MPSRFQRQPSTGRSSRRGGVPAYAALRLPHRLWERVKGKVAPDADEMSTAATVLDQEMDVSTASDEARAICCRPVDSCTFSAQGRMKFRRHTL